LEGISIEVTNSDVVKGSNHYRGECEMRNTEEINLNCKAFELYSEGNWFVSELGHRVDRVRFL
jgi:hypothetical protein